MGPDSAGFRQLREPAPPSILGVDSPGPCHLALTCLTHRKPNAPGSAQAEIGFCGTPLTALQRPGTGHFDGCPTGRSLHPGSWGTTHPWNIASSPPAPQAGPWEGGVHSDSPHFHQLPEETPQPAPYQPSSLTHYLGQSGTDGTWMWACPPHIGVGGWARRVGPSGVCLAVGLGSVGRHPCPQPHLCPAPHPGQTLRSEPRERADSGEKPRDGVDPG